MSEPNQIWEVECNCRFKKKFRHEHDAQAVFRAHSNNNSNRCRETELKSMHAYPKDGVNPGDTLPYDMNTDPDNLSDPEMFNG